MKRFTALLILSCIVVIANLSLSMAAFQADINQDNDISLEDVILGLQIVAGESPAIPSFVEDIDVDEDGKIGLSEVINTLQSISRSGLELKHQAVFVGPLSGAGITAYQAEDLNNKIEGTKQANNSVVDLSVAGTFDLGLPGIADSQWVVVSATIGKDIDYDGNGVANTSAVQNLGTLHALARVSDWRTRSIKISPLTELVWRYAENLISAVPADELEIRLNDLAHYLIKTDINGDNIIDWHDFLSFNPATQTHRDSLKTSYDWLSAQNEDGHSILASLLAGDEEQMLSCMDETYSYLMTRFAVPDSRYHSVKISLSVFGQGSATSGAPYNLAVDSTAAKPVMADHVFLPTTATNTMTFTANAGLNCQILSWTGCDIISSDLSQCTVPLNKSQDVVINFGRTTTELRGILHDLTRTNNYLGQNTLAVLIPADMTDMITEMATAAIGHFVVGTDGGGFLRRITGITKVTPTNYMLETVEAALDEVIAQGTGHLFKEMTNGDLEGYVASTSAAQSATISPSAFTGLAGIQLIPSNRADDKTFRLILGNPEHDAAISQSTISGKVLLYDNGKGGTLHAQGEFTFETDFDTGSDYDWIGLKSSKVITNVDVNNTFALTASAKLDKFPRERKKLGTMRFAPLTFFIGPVPVWITPTVDVYFYGEGKIEIAASFGISVKQKVSSGFLYNRDSGLSPYNNHSIDWDVMLPESTTVKASIEGGFEVRPSLKFYGLEGPALPIDGFLKISSSNDSIGSVDPDGNLCSDGIVVKMSYGTTVSSMWEMSGQSKIGQMLHLDKLEDKTKYKIVSFEWPISKWNLLNSCVKPSHLAIEGEGIVRTINYGNPDGLVSDLTITNDGDEVLNWNTSGIPNGVTVFPSQGELNPGEHEVVQMSVATATLPVGRFYKKVLFYNEDSIGSTLADEKFGNTYKTIDITVLDTITDTPVITSATSTSVGRVDLAWNFTNSESKPFIGFQIFATTTPDNPQTYKQIHSTDIYARSVLLSGLTPDSTYSIMVRAYSVTLPGPFSAPAAAKVAGSPPGVVVVSALSQEGSVFTVPKTGTYRFAIDGEAYVNCPSPDCGGGYTTKVLIYKNRAISWSASCYQSYPGPGNWDYELGTWNNYDTVRQAVAATEGEYLDIQLEEGNILTFIIQDCRDCCFGDNSGYTTVRVELLEPETCSDGIQNQGELAVDCGGPCGSCWKVYGCGMTSCTGTDPSVCGTAFSTQPLTVVPSVHHYFHCASVDVHLPDGSDFWGPTGGFYQLLPGSVVITPLQ